MAKDIIEILAFPDAGKSREQWEVCIKELQTNKGTRYKLSQMERSAHKA